MQLSGRTAVITGAAGTLGAALVAGFLKADCRAVLMVDLDPDALDVARSRFASDRVRSMVCDVGDTEAMDDVVQQAEREFGQVDIMVNNAGVIAPNARLHHSEIAAWERALRVNVIGTLNGTKAALSVMRPRRSGSIINTGSVAGVTAWTHSGPYCVSKAAVIHLTKVTALEYADDGIRVNCVCPGSFESGMFSSVPRAAIDAIDARHPLGLGTAEDLVGAYVYLASEASRWTTGSVLMVDGGYSVP